MSVADPTAAARQSVFSALAGAMLVSGLSYFAAAPFIALYVVFGIGLVGLVWALLCNGNALLSPPALSLYAAMLLIAATLPFVWHGPDDLVGLVIFFPLLIAPGVTAIIEEDRRWLAPYAVPLLALIGALAALGGGLFEYYTLGQARVGMGNNPIHYGGIAVILGFVALTGVAAGRSAWRVVFLLGPLAGIAAVALSGSRGTLLAWAMIAIVTLPFLAAWFWRSVGFWICLAAAAQAATILYFTGYSGRALRVYELVSQLLSGEALSTSDAARTALYTSAWEQFQSAPIFGHGFTELMAVAGPRLVELGASELENLHSDLADFAVVAGAFGILAYVAILVAPLLLLLQRRVRANRALVLGCIILPVSYAVLGATNAMFGVLAQTVLYALLLGILTAQARGLGEQRLEHAIDGTGPADPLPADGAQPLPLGLGAK